MYVQNRKTFKVIQKQEKKKNRPLSPEVIEFGNKTKDLLNKMHSYECDTCKLFKKHMKSIDVLMRYMQKQKALDKEIEKRCGCIVDSYELKVRGICSSCVMNKIKQQRQ